MPDASSSPICPKLIEAVIDSLGQGELMLHVLDDDDYSKHLPVAMNAAIGGHYRHCLDHFICLIKALKEGPLNYDDRQREPNLETNRFAALNLTRQLQRDFKDRLKGLTDRELKVINKINYEAEAPQEVKSSLEREMMYVMAHAVHHFALIRIMAGIMKITLPREFGVAPSTADYRSRR